MRFRSTHEVITIHKIDPIHGYPLYIHIWVIHRQLQLRLVGITNDVVALIARQRYCLRQQGLVSLELSLF